LIAVVSILLQTSAIADEFGIFELLNKSSQSFTDTRDAVESALQDSELTLHASHAVRVPDEKQQAHVFVLTSPDYLAAAAGESPRTVSAQVLRVAVYTWGEDQQTLVNMTNPESHAMIFYAESDRYDDMLAAARQAAADLRNALAAVPGESVSVQQSPLRSEKHLRKYKGDGPARMMTKFRRYEKSQRSIGEAKEDEFNKTVQAISATLDSSEVSGSDEAAGWEQLVQIPLGENTVLFGLTNPYIEDKMISINSRFRSDGKTDDAPYPGVDHVAALPTEILVVKEDGQTVVLQYGQMWRMQLYFWDSGYRAFTANVGVPGAIFDSIEDLLTGPVEDLQ
jgi:hypothetical protein